VQTVGADRNQRAGRKKRPSIPCGANQLIDDARHDEHGGAGEEA
jgi:hypothetical protein